MRRRTLHAGFGVAALLCAAVMLIQVLRLRHAVELNRLIAASDQWAAAADAVDIPSVEPHVGLAHAAALARAHRDDAALRAFNALTVRGAGDDIARAALFDAGNLYVRQGVHAAGNPAVFLPMLELAKQRYRDLLRIDPWDWDARFNLERALRLAPEEQEDFEPPQDRPIETPPNKVPELLAPDLP